MSRKRIMVYIAVFLVGFFAISFFSFYTVTHPPEIDIPYTPEAFNLPAQDVSLKTSDGISIAGWHIPSQSAPDRALLLLHGYPANKADMLSLAEELYPDFSLLLIDFRSFGESGGNATTLGIKESRDVEAAIDFLSERYEYIGIFGYSYGGTVALLHTTSDERIDAVATYSTFANLRTLGHDTYSHLWLLKYPLVALMDLHARIFFGEWASSVSPQKRASDISAPAFIGHSKHDPVIPFHHAEHLTGALTKSGNAPETYFTDDTTHIGLPADLANHLTQFFNTHLPLQ